MLVDKLRRLPTSHFIGRSIWLGVAIALIASACSSASTVEQSPDDVTKPIGSSTAALEIRGPAGASITWSESVRLASAGKIVPVDGATLTALTGTFEVESVNELDGLAELRFDLETAVGDRAGVVVAWEAENGHLRLLPSSESWSINQRLRTRFG